MRGVQCAGISVDQHQNLLYLDFAQESAVRVIGRGRKNLTKGIRREMSSGIVGDSVGNVWVADTRNNAIKRISIDGKCTDFNLEHAPRVLCLDEHQRLFYSTDCQIFRFNPLGIPDLILGTGERGCTTGTALETKINYPAGICVDRTGTVFVSDSFNGRVLSVKNGSVRTLCKGLKYPFGVVQLPEGELLVAESDAHCIRRINLDGTSTVIAGKFEDRGNEDGTEERARFSDPRSMCVDKEGNVYVVDYLNKAIRKLTFPSRWSVGKLCCDTERQPHIASFQGIRGTWSGRC